MQVVLDVFLILVVVAAVAGPLLAWEKTDTRRCRWIRLLSTVGLVQSLLLFLIPYEQHAWRHGVLASSFFCWPQDERLQIQRWNWRRWWRPMGRRKA